MDVEETRQPYQCLQFGSFKGVCLPTNNSRHIGHPRRSVISRRIVAETTVMPWLSSSIFCREAMEEVEDEEVAEEEDDTR